MAAACRHLVLDGGMGHILRRSGVEIKGEIGSMERFLGVALANLDSPSLVERCHGAFLDAGCDVVTTNSYSCVPACMSLASERKLALPEIIGAAGKLARASVAARGDSGRKVLVAGCVPPLKESYRFDRVLPDDELTAQYTQIVAAVAPHSDVLLCETMSLAREGRAAALAAAEAKLPVWVSWTLHEDNSGRLRSGETVAEAVEAVRDIAAVEACLFNCCNHESIVVALPELKRQVAEKFPAGQAAAMRLGAYANAFKTVKAGAEKNGAASEYREDFTPERYAETAMELVDLGADLVGGCCGIFPEHIKAFVKARQAAGSEAPCSKAPRVE